MAATLTPAAVSGKNILFTASEAVFLPGDVGRQIIFEASRAIIVSSGVSAGDAPTAVVHADIIDVWPNTEAMLAGTWFLRLSPQADLTPSTKGPIGTKTTLTASKSCFRQADLGKYIIMYGGVVEIQGVTDTTTVAGEILNDFKVDEITPGVFPAAVAGTWRLEVSSWSPENGFPRTGEFVGGRLVQASTQAQPTNFWMSAPDDFGNYAVGIKADDSVDYAIASKKLNRIEWIAENTQMFLGGSDVEMEATSGKPNEPFGGDIIPLVQQISNVGSAPIQPCVVNSKLIYVDRSRQRIFMLTYNLDDDKIIPIELTDIANHITGGGLKLGPIAYQKRLDQRLYFVREDGTLVTLTYLPNQKVVGFTRLVTDGFFEAVGCITGVIGKSDEVWVIVRRIINGETKRYVEVLEDNFGGLQRAWQELHTDCAIVYQGAPVDNVPVGFAAHLEAKTVDVVADGGYRGTRVIANGRFTEPLQEEYSEMEIGLHYDATLETMRPSVPNATIEGLPRSWTQLWIRVFESIGGSVNGEPVVYPPGVLDALTLFTGDRQVTPQGIQGNDTDGAIRIVQDQPYPFTVLCTFGTLEIGDHD